MHSNDITFFNNAYLLTNIIIYDKDLGSYFKIHAEKTLKIQVLRQKKDEG